MGAKQPRLNLSDILRQLVEETDGHEVTFGDLVNALSTRSYGPLLVLPAIIAASPIGGIPGMSLITGTLIIVIAVQMVLGLNHPWLPRRLLEFDFDREKLKRGVDKTLPWVERAERLVKHRLSFMTHPVAARLVAVLCIGLAALFYPLAVLPFAVALPACGVLAMALGITARDGVLIILGIGMGAASVWMTVTFWPF